MADPKTSSTHRPPKVARTGAATPAVKTVQDSRQKAAVAKPLEEMRAVAGDRERLFRLSPAFVVLVVGAVGLVLTSYPTFVLLAVGMAPTLVGIITELEPNAYRIMALGFLNFSGVLPYLLDLWVGGNKLEMALRIITDPFALVIMFGAAGLAALVFWAAPQVAATFLSVMGGHRRNALLKSQELLIKEWGQDVDPVRVNRGLKEASL